MANRFLALMDKRGQRSLELLKRLYRAASKRVHPDAAAGANAEGQPAADKSSASFLVIRQEYEEALAILNAETAQPWNPGSWTQGSQQSGQKPPVRHSARSGGARSGGTKAGTTHTMAQAEAGQANRDHAGNNARASADTHASTRTAAHAQVHAQEPETLRAFREACAQLGSDIRAWDHDPYRWKPSAQTVTELLLLAHALTPGRLETERACLETVLAALLARRAELARYPGIMTRYAMLYRAFSAWSLWRNGGDAVDHSACRTQLVDLENPTVTLVRASAIQDVTDAFPGAASFLRIAWAIPGNEL